MFFILISIFKHGAANCSGNRRKQVSLAPSEPGVGRLFTDCPLYGNDGSS